MAWNVEASRYIKLDFGKIAKEIVCKTIID